MDEEIRIELENFRKKLEDHENRLIELEKLFKTKPAVIEKKLSPKEFILSKNPIGDVQKTLVIGYYLEKYDGLTPFNLKDLEEGFRSAKEKVPKNINDKVYQNTAKGFMMEAKEKKDNLKSWNLTGSGERFVENNFKLNN